MNIELQNYINLRDKLTSIYDSLNNFNNALNDFDYIMKKGYSIDGISATYKTASKMKDENKIIMNKIYNEILPALNQKIILLERSL